MRRLLAALLLLPLPALAQDAARPEAMIGFFSKGPASRSPAMATGGFGRIVRTSYYGGGERLNSHTASGHRFWAGGLTAAHRSLPFGTRLRLSHRGRSVVVEVNDRGPAAWTGRELDVSRGAAVHLGFVSQGVVNLRMEVMR